MVVAPSGLLLHPLSVACLPGIMLAKMPTMRAASVRRDAWPSPSGRLMLAIRRGVLPPAGCPW